MSGYEGTSTHPAILVLTQIHLTNPSRTQHQVGQTPRSTPPPTRSQHLLLRPRPNRHIRRPRTSQRKLTTSARRCRSRISPTGQLLRHDARQQRHFQRSSTRRAHEHPHIFTHAGGGPPTIRAERMSGRIHRKFGQSAEREAHRGHELSHLRDAFPG